MIRNSVQLSATTTRKHILRILEAGLQAVSPEQLMREQFAYEAKSDTLYVQGKAYQLANFEKVVVIGVGKVSAHVAELIEAKMQGRIAGGIVIDIVPANTKKIVSRVGTHPLPSSVNVSATDELVTMLQNLTAKDLVLAVISGGGSSLLTSPQVVSLEEERKITQALMDCGVSITEMNTVRKHLSSVKGGNLAKYAYPASMISLIFSDIPRDDISQVASGPTVLDRTTINDATEIMNRYQVLDRCSMDHCGMRETPKEQRYFKNVTNILFCSSGVALQAMERCAHDLGLRVKVWNPAFSGEAREVAKAMLADLEPNQCLLAAGESVVTIKDKVKGSGGRNQEMALAALLSLPDKVTFAALNSDGHDNSDVAGALVDQATAVQAKQLGLDLSGHLAHHDEYGLLSDLGASIMTGHTGSNVSDLVVAIKE